LKIIQIFGANVLGCLIVIGWCAIFTIPFLLIIKRCCLRTTKVCELIGLDVDQLMLGNSDIENFVQFVVTEYFPENAGDYLRKKRRLLEMAKKGRKGAKKQLTKEELTKIKELLDQEIRDVFGPDTPHSLFDQDEAAIEEVVGKAVSPRDVDIRVGSTLGKRPVIENYFRDLFDKKRQDDFED
jgi:hypothetical protein